MRRLVPMLATALLASAALAQTTPTPDAVPMGDRAGMPANPGTSTSETTPAADPGLPSDVHATPPPVASQAPPPTADDTAPTEAKSKGRAKPASTAKKRPQD